MDMPVPALAGQACPWQDITMIRFILIAALLASGAVACTSSKAYGPAKSSSAQGYSVQPIETNRYRVTYTALSKQEARRYALRRAAEVTIENGAQWFRVVRSATDTESGRSGGSSVSVGGSRSSYGSGVGVGVGIGLPLGGSSEKTTESLEILIGSGDKPADVEVYDAASVLANLRD